MRTVRVRGQLRMEFAGLWPTDQERLLASIWIPIIKGRLALTRPV